jgi:hypothetical protein
MSRESKILIAVLVVVVGGMIGLFVLANGSGSDKPANLGDTHYLTTPAPWDANTTGLKARLAAIGLPALSAEGTVLHIHQHLDIFVHGKAVAVPANIGISRAESFISDLHVHDASGVIHVESPEKKDFNFGQLMDVWGVKFDSTHLGSYSVDSTNKLVLYVDGQPVTDMRGTKLTAHQELVLTYGSASELPATIPTTYSFAAGE